MHIALGLLEELWVEIGRALECIQKWTPATLLWFQWKAYSKCTSLFTYAEIQVYIVLYATRAGLGC